MAFSPNIVSFPVKCFIRYASYKKAVDPHEHYLFVSLLVYLCNYLFI